MTQLTTLIAYTGVYPDRATQDENARALAVFNFLEFAGGSLVADINTNFVSKLNTLSGEIAAAAQQVAEDAETASEAAIIAVEAKNTAVNAVSQLPDGTVNDAVISEDDTWSSQKINTELSGKADITTSLTLAQAQAAALCF